MLYATSHVPPVVIDAMLRWKSPAGFPDVVGGLHGDDGNMLLLPHGSDDVEEGLRAALLRSL